MPSADAADRIGPIVVLWRNQIALLHHFEGRSIPAATREEKELATERNIRYTKTELLGKLGGREKKNVQGECTTDEPSAITDRDDVPQGGLVRLRNMLNKRSARS